MLHRFTIEKCLPKVPIRIKGVTEPQLEGTLIFENVEKADPQFDQRPKRPTAVTTKHHITVVNIHSYRKVGSVQFMKQILDTLNEFMPSVDLWESVITITMMLGC